MPGPPTIIAFDLDGVIFDTLTALRERLLNKFGRTFEIEDVRQYSLFGLTNDRELDEDIAAAFMDPRFYQTIEPYPGVSQALAKLAQDPIHKIIAITSRPYQAHGVTGQALAKHFYRTFTGLERCASGAKPRKAVACRVKVAFEDHAPTAVSYAKKGILTYLIRRPYNAMDRLAARVVPVESVAEGVDDLLARRAAMYHEALDTMEVASGL